MIVIDAQGSRKLERDLDLLARRAIPFATRNALNASAFAARTEWKKTIEGRLILRSSWTTRSLKVVKVDGLDIDRMQAVVGTPLDYMETQEDGATVASKGKNGVAVPTSSAAGQAMKARPRTRRVQGKNYLSAIHLANRVQGSRTRKNTVATLLAIRNGTRVAFLDLRRRKGIFRVLGDAKRPRVRMIWDLSKKTVKVPKSATLATTMETLTPRLVTLHDEAIKQQLRRAKLLGY